MWISEMELEMRSMAGVKWYNNCTATKQSPPGDLSVIAKEAVVKLYAHL
jgi:hypothetical protein